MIDGESYPLSVESMARLTPEKTSALVKVAQELVKSRDRNQLAHTEVIASAAAGRRVNLG